MKALVFETAGEARDVLALRDIQAPEPAEGHVLVAVESSPLHPADFGFVRGAYRVKPSFPQVAGLSGAGRVVRGGKGVALAPGSRVAFRWPGAWAEQASVPVERVFTVPDDIAIDQAAQFVLNPITAWGLLELARVEPGEWLGLTAAASSVAALVSALAEQRGARVIGIARASSVSELGPNVLRVSESEPELAGRIRALTAGAGLPALIDCVGGPLLGQLFPALRQGATVVAYGALSPEPVLVRNATLVYGNLTWLGFGIDRWSASQSPVEAERMTASLWDGIRRGSLPLPVRGRFRLKKFEEALRVTNAGGRGKVLLLPS